MLWITHKKPLQKDYYLESEDGKYRITNSGSRGGDSYSLWGRMEQSVMNDDGEWIYPFCRQLGMGTLKQVKEKADEI